MSNKKIFSEKLANYLVENVFSGESVLQIGLSKSEYSDFFNKTISCKFLEFSQLKSFTNLQSNYIFCIDLIEKISRELEDETLEFISRIAKDKVIIIWPSVDTDSQSTNLRNSSYIRKKFHLKGFEYDTELTYNITSDFVFEQECEWLEKSIFVFIKKTKKFNNLVYSYESNSTSNVSVLPFRNLTKRESELIESKVFDEYLVSKLKVSDFRQNRKRKITANISTNPKTFNSLLKMLHSIRGQFDEIRIYLNGFDFIPQELFDYTTQLGELEENGRFFWVDSYDELYFTLSDEFLYPENFVEKTIPMIRDRVVCYQGKIITSKSDIYSLNDVEFLFSSNLFHEKKIDVADSCFMAFDTNHFKPSLWRTRTQSVDLLVSFECSLFAIQIYCLPHISGWLRRVNYRSSLDIFEKSMILKQSIQLWQKPEMEIFKTIVYELDRESNYFISSLIKSNKIRNLYHVGFSDGSLIKQISHDLPYINFIGITTEIDRAFYCQKKHSINHFFICDDFCRLIFDEDSFIFVQDPTVSLDELRIAYDSLSDNCFFLTCEKINEQGYPVKLKNEYGKESSFYLHRKVSNRRNFLIPYQKSFVISINNCEISNKRLLRFLNKFNSSNLEVVSGVNGRDCDYDGKVNDFYDIGLLKKELSSVIKMTDGEVGCCMSHLKVWEKISEGSEDVCIVFEDDAFKIIPGFNFILSKICTELPSDWDLFIIGFKQYRQSKKISEKISLAEDFYLSHCYMIKKKTTKEIIENFLPINYPLDTFLSSLSNKLKVYRHNFAMQNSGFISGYLVRQSDESSLIENHTNNIYVK